MPTLSQDAAECRSPCRLFCTPGRGRSPQAGPAFPKSGELDRIYGAVICPVVRRSSSPPVKEDPAEEGSNRAMKKIPPIKSVMTPSPLSVAIDEPLRVAEDMMIDHEIRHLLVTESDSLVGLVSDRDIAFMSNSPEPDLRDRLRVRDVCSLEVYTIDVDEPLDLVLREMASRRIGSAIVTKKGRAVGLFTTTDACRCFADFLQARFPRAKKD